jgi:amidase
MIRSLVVLFLFLPFLVFSQYQRDQSLEDQLKVIDSKFIDRSAVFGELEKLMGRFENTEKFDRLLLEKSIPEIQRLILEEQLTYQELTAYFLFRIYKLDRQGNQALNSVISILPDALTQAELADEKFQNMSGRQKQDLLYSIHGMPILLKDNINTANTATTAGAAIMLNHLPEEDAPIVNQLRKNGAVILGKANLSEWAYYFCGECPSGYSAVGGQTLNPYGPKNIDTGGSSSGSGVAVAANFAVAAVGTETAGSILSPSSANSIVGLKPTVGTFAGEGIVPISSYLDTAGPMTKSVIDNQILFNAMLPRDSKKMMELSEESQTPSIKGLRLGIPTRLLDNALLIEAINQLNELGVEVIKIEDESPKLEGFLTILNADMQRDLSKYFAASRSKGTNNWTIKDIIQLNRADSLKNMPYGQRLLENVAADQTSGEKLSEIKRRLTQSTQKHYRGLMKQHKLDAFISVNNSGAAHAAIAFFPAITVPMGYNDITPTGITFIAPSGEEQLLFRIAAAYENRTKKRIAPEGYGE